MKRNILIISYSYPPSNVPAAQRPYALAKYLDKEKYNITVITCSNADVSWGVNDRINPEIESVDLIKIKSFLSRSATNIKKNLNIGNRGIIGNLKSIFFKFIINLIIPDQAIFWYPRVREYLLKNKR